MDLGLKGRSAAVAAGSRGLGQATALALSREGAQVAICGRDPKKIRAAADAIESETGARVLAVTADVTSRADCERFIAETVGAYGRLDILVTNTGGPPAGNFEGTQDAAWERAYTSLLENVINLVRAAAPHMKQARWGRILNIASLSVKQPIDNLILSNTFRPAIAGFSKSLSKELGPHGILVNTICPGYTRTDRLEELAESRVKAAGITRDQYYETLSRNVPLGRVAEPEEFASVAAFLCSERASYVSGIALQVDGGASVGLA
ncbi:MAG: SDR family oxidoreductase [Vicinamibacteria bacterium]